MLRTWRFVAWIHSCLSQICNVLSDADSFTAHGPNVDEGTPRGVLWGCRTSGLLLQ